MSAPEVLFCNILKVQYAATVASISTVISIPTLVLKILKSNLQRVKIVVYAVLAAAVDVLVAQLDALFKLVDVSKTDEGMAFCHIAFSCKALTNALFDEDSDVLSFMSEAQKEEAKNGYEFFETYICKNGLKTLVTNWIDEQVDAIETKIDEIEDELLGATGIDDLVEAYMTTLQDTILVDGKNIFELLSLLDDFAECAFAACNAVATADNKKEDFNEKLQIENTGNGFTYVVGELEESILEQDAEMRRKMQTMRDKISRWRSAQITEIGTKPDEVML